MADLKITDLTETTEAPDTSYIPIDDGTTTNKITVKNFNEEANATAKRYAEASEGYAQNAAAAKDLAVGAKDDALLAVSSASDYADAASLSADAASGSATEASGYVGQAQTAASNASASALAAAASAQGVEDYATLAKSWAEGNTGVRPDEAVNNAKYWAGVAQGAAGGGVTTFNGRSGVVVPQAHDYNAGQVDYNNATSELDATDVQSAIDEIQGEIDGLGSAADKDSTNEITQGSEDLIESGAVYTGLNGKANKSVVKTATLSAGSTTVTFTQLPTTGDYLIDFFTSTGINYTEIDTSVSGQVTLTYEEQEAAVTVSCEIKEA